MDCKKHISMVVAGDLQNKNFLFLIYKTRIYIYIYIDKVFFQKIIK